MSEQQPNPRSRLVVHRDQPLVGVIQKQNSQEMNEYFVDDQEVDAASNQDSRKQALSRFGAWRHLDSDDALDELDRIRHESKPTPPIELPELG